MRLTKQTSNAIRILVSCARARRLLITMSEIAAENRITEFNVAKIALVLSRAGFLASVRGRSGGLRLARPAAEIRLGDVVRATEAPSMQAHCHGDDLDCAIRPLTPMNRFLDEAWTSFLDVLDQHSLADLASGGRAMPEPLPKRAPSPSARGASRGGSPA